MYTFVVNPNARSGMGQKIWDKLEVVLKRKNITYEVFFTQYQKHATHIIYNVTSDGEEHTIIALGGDGTINEVVNGIHDFTKATLGYIPIGSGNDFARGLKLPRNPRKALEQILARPCISEVNVCNLSYKAKKRRFVVSSGIGFDADICHESVVSRLKCVLNKLKLGKLTYVCIALHRLFVTKPCEVNVTLNHGEPLFFPDTRFVAVMNNQYEGGGVKFCPKAKNNDDLLDIIVVSRVSKRKVLCVLPLALFGLHTWVRGVHIYTCSHVDIQAEKALPVHTDGENIFLQRRMEAQCIPERLRVITSPR